VRWPQHDSEDHVHNSPVDRRISYTSDCRILELPLWLGSSSLHFLDSFFGWSSGLILGSFQKQCHPGLYFILGTVLRKKMRIRSTDSLTASSANKTSACSATSVIKHTLLFDQRPPWKLTYHLCECALSCECFWHVLIRGIASSGRAVLDDRGRDCHWAGNVFTACEGDPIIDKSGLSASGTLRFSRCASRRMLTQFPSPLRRDSVSVARLPSHIDAPSAHVSWTRSDVPWPGLAPWSVSADHPHDVFRNSPGYHLRSSSWGRNLYQSFAIVHSIYDDHSQDDCTPTPGLSWARSPGRYYSDVRTVLSTICRTIRTSKSEWSFMSIWQQLRRAIAESAGAGVRIIPTEYRYRQSSSTSELHCGLSLQDQQKVGILWFHDQCATVLRTVGGRVRIRQFSVLRNRGQNAV